MHEQRIKVLSDAIETLRPTRKMVLKLRMWDELPYAEIESRFAADGVVDRTGSPVHSRDRRAARPAPGAETVLVADDDPAVCEMLNRLLTREGYRVVTAERGENEALVQKLVNGLQEVEHALAKLGTERFGFCEKCNQPIAPARLEARPEARLCIDCAAAARR